MDLSSATGIASYAPASANTQIASQIGVATLNKSLDLQAEMAEQVVERTPDSTAGLPDNVGRNINVTA